MYNKSDAKFDYLNGLLKVKGGDGFCADGQVNRLLKGNQYPLGCAITENPAADVSGIYTLLSLLQHEEKEMDEDEESESNLNSTNNKNSVITENDVNQNEADSFYMTDEQYNKLEGLIKAAIDAKEGESQASAAVTQIREALTQSGNEWKSKAEVAEENASKAKADLENLKTELSNASQELENLKKDLSVKEAADRFNTRMSALEGVYEFSEAQLQIVSGEVRSLDEKEESFASYLEKAKVLFAHCDKETIKANLELANASKDKGEEKEEKEDGELDTTDESKANITNNNGGDSNKESLIERIRKNGLEIETK
jgi:chromosome segregation ATPase